MRVTVDASRCQGHGQCQLACPELFEFDEQGFARIRSEQVPARLADDAARAARNCPERAIRIEA